MTDRAPDFEGWTLISGLRTGDHRNDKIHHRLDPYPGTEYTHQELWDNWDLERNGWDGKTYEPDASGLDDMLVMQLERPDVFVFSNPDSVTLHLNNYGPNTFGYGTIIETRKSS